jgi:hypothetical protein
MNLRYLLTGTSKGLVVHCITAEGVENPVVHFTGFPVSTVAVDESTGNWWVALSHRHWGEKLHCSTDQGQTWQAAGIPSFRGYDFRPGTPASLKKIWTLQSAGKDKPGCLWIGTEPGGLFYSNDHGQTFHLNEALWHHPSRLDDQQWFGTGKDFPFIHSIIVDPRDSDHVYVGISSAGVFETRDGGNTWAPRNTGLIAAYLPNATTDVGHDPHQVLQCRHHPDVLWQQNHCGIFRSTDGGKTWQNVSGQDDYPSYGFAIAINHHDPDNAWVIPAQSDQSRIPVDLRLRVMKTTDGGKTWQSSSRGLPEDLSFDLVLRHALVKDGSFMAFGTNNGNLYVSHDEGETWHAVSQNLSPVFSLAISAQSQS